MTTDGAVDQAELVLRGMASAVRHDGKLTDTQTSLLTAIGKYLLGVDSSPAGLEPLDPGDLADAVTDPTLRRRAVHGMVTLEIVMDPVPPAVADQVERYASALQVDDAMLTVARDYSEQAMDQAMQDYARNSYPAQYYADHAADLPATATTSGTDEALAAKWTALESCRGGSLGRTVWDFYQQRGFAFPGTPGAVPALLAQHDWVHCLADYGTSATGEIEVFSFIASAIPDAKGFTYAVVIIGLFETGYVAAVPGVATARPGHLSAPGGAVRFTDALRRGLGMHLDVMGAVDWFDYADEPIDDVRTKLGVQPKGDDTVAAGSLSALDPNAVFGKSN